MNPHRKGNAFPTQGVPGDPRLLDQLHRQQIRGPNMMIQHTHSGTIITPKAIARAKTTPSHWKVSLTSNNGGYNVTVAEGYIYEGLLNPVRIAFQETEDFVLEDVLANDVICIKYTYLDSVLTIEAYAGGTDFATFDPTEDDGEDPPVVTATRYPLAKIIDTGEVDGDGNPIFSVEQMAMNHLAKVQMCLNGVAITSFTPI